MSYTKSRNDPTDNFGFSADSSLRLIVKKTAQTTGIKINSQGLQIGLHACRPTPFSNCNSMSQTTERKTHKGRTDV